ncbi:MAG: hypothetical protein AAFR17_07790 [Pseudomonadota bacterium]
MSDPMKTDLDAMLDSLARDERAARPVVSARLSASVLALAADAAEERRQSVPAVGRGVDSAPGGMLRVLGGLMPGAWPGGAVAAMVLGLMLGMGVGYGYGERAMALTLLTIGDPVAMADGLFEGEGPF